VIKTVIIQDLKLQPSTTVSGVLVASKVLSNWTEVLLPYQMKKGISIPKATV